MTCQSDCLQPWLASAPFGCIGLLCRGGCAGRQSVAECDRAGAWLQVRNTQGQEGGFCKVGLRLKAYPDNPIQCVASACQFKEGSGKIQCKDAQCACGQGTCPGARSSPAPPVCWPAVQGL